MPGTLPAWATMGVPLLLLASFCVTSSSLTSAHGLSVPTFCGDVGHASVPRLSLRGGYDNGYEGGGGYERGGGGYSRGYEGGGGYDGGGGGYRGGGGFRGRGGRGRGRRGPPEGPIDELKLYVGGLAWEVDDAALAESFAAFGQCEAKVMTDKYSGRSRGFGFVSFTDIEACNAARDAMNGKELQGRQISVNNARQRTYEPTEGGGGGGGGYQGGGGGGGYEGGGGGGGYQGGGGGGGYEGGGGGGEMEGGGGEGME